MSEESEYNKMLKNNDVNSNNHQPLTTNNTVQKSFERTFENYNIRCFKINNELYFVGKDIAEALEYADSAQAINNNCKTQIAVKDLKLKPVPGTEFNEIKGLDALRELHPRLLLITELDVYRLIMRSGKPEAEKFQDWVYSVIKDIRKTGSYNLTTSNVLDSAVSIIENIINDKIIGTVTNILDDKVSKIILMKDSGRGQEFNIDDIVNFINTHYAPPGQTTDATKLKKLLTHLKIVKHNDQPYKEAIQNGLVRVEVNVYQKDDNVFFTEKGRETIITALINAGAVKI
jgi:prophage antirepressor-like protein